MTCGYGMFDYGKCGCESLPDGIFDFYGRMSFSSGLPSNTPIPDAGLIRHPSIYPIFNAGSVSVDAVNLFYNSKQSPVNWILPSNDPDIGDGEFHATAPPGVNGKLGTRVVSKPSTPEIVWAYEIRDSQRVIARYNAASLTEETYTDVANTFPRFVLATRPGLTTTTVVAVSDTELFAYDSAGNSYLIDSSGTLTTYASLALTADFDTDVSDSDTITLNADLIAQRYWPMVAGVRTRVTGGTTTRQLFYGPAVIVDDPAGGGGKVLTVTDRTVVEEATGGTAVSWQRFDMNAGGWAGVYTVGSTVTWMLNDVEITPWATSAYAWHLAHPSGGVAYVVATHLHTTDYYRVVVYDEDGEVWHSADMQYSAIGGNHPPRIHASSDRWLYFYGTLFEDQFPNGIREPSEEEVPMWLVRHDGSQSCPAGRIGSGPLEGKIAGWPSPYSATNHVTLDTTGTVPYFTHDCVHQSSAVGHSLPDNLDGIEELAGES